MASLLPMAVIARHLFNDPPAPYQRPAVTTRRPEEPVTSAARAPKVVPAVSRPVVAVRRPSLLSRFAQLVFHPVSTVRH